MCGFTTQVAQAFSEDAARKGGDLGWKRRNEVGGASATARGGVPATCTCVCSTEPAAWTDKYPRQHLLEQAGLMPRRAVAEKSSGVPAVRRQTRCATDPCLRRCCLQLVGPFADVAFKLQVGLSGSAWSACCWSTMRRPKPTLCLAICTSRMLCRCVPQVGQMSEPIKTQFGYHLILCEGRKA